MKLQQKSQRNDGRHTNELRPLSYEQNVLNQPDGSTLFKQGDTAVLVGVYGPAQAKHTRYEFCDTATISVSIRLDKNEITSFDRELESFVRASIESNIIGEQYPRAMIDISVQVIQDGGSLLATIVNAVNLSLINSGIAIRRFIAGISCSQTDDGSLWIDPSLSEEESAHGVATLIVDCESGEIISSLTTGHTSESSFFAYAEIAKRGSESVKQFFRLTLESKLIDEQREDISDAM